MGIISLTKCKPIKLCLCKLGSKCFSGSQQHCAEYINDITKHTSTRFAFKEQKSGVAVHVSVPDGKCVILQFRRAESDLPHFSDRFMCGFPLAFTGIVRYYITGTLQQLQLDWKHIPICCIEMQCHGGISGRSLEYVKVQETSTFYQNPDGHIAIHHGRSATEQHPMSLRLVPVRTVITNSWLDVTIQKNRGHVKRDNMDVFALLLRLIPLQVSVRQNCLVI